MIIWINVTKHFGASVFYVDFYVILYGWDKCHFKDQIWALLRHFQELYINMQIQERKNANITVSTYDRSIS
jgi:hypothetical protein